MHRLVSIFFCIIIVQAQIFDADTIFTEEEKAHIYEHSKILISDGLHFFESEEDYSDWLASIPHRGCMVWLDYWWKAYQSDSILTEDEFFTATGFPEKAEIIKRHRNNVSIMKWSSPFLIVGGILLSGFSSNWGQNRNASYVLPVVGVGASVVGLIFGAEGLSKSNKNKYEIYNAINAMDFHNRLLKENLGIEDTPIVEIKEFDVQAIMDSLGIEIVPYNTLDEKVKPLNEWYSDIQYGGPFWSGTRIKIVVQILIDTRGKVIDCTLYKSGGIRYFDKTVLEVSKKLEFEPPKKDGIPVYTICKLPYIFYTW